MNFNDAEAEIRAFFDAAWSAATEVSYPDDQDFSIPDGETWVRFNCVENEGQQVTMGSPAANRFRHFGIVTVQIFQPEGQGSTDARDKATTALGVFMGAVTTNGVHFQRCYARQIGNDGRGYYQINVVAPFYYDEIT